MMRTQNYRSVAAWAGFVVCCTLLTACPPSGLTIPDVVGLPEDIARATILDAGYAIGEVFPVASPTIPAGNVVEQDPLGDTRATLGTEVDLYVSFGSEGLPGNLEVVFETEVFMTGDDTSFTSEFSASVLLDRQGLTSTFWGSDVLFYDFCEFSIPDGISTMELYDGEMEFMVILKGGNALPEVYWQDPERPAEWITIHPDGGLPLTYPDKTEKGWMYWYWAHIMPFDFGAGPEGFRSFPDHWDIVANGSGLVARNSYVAQTFDVGAGVGITANVTVEVWRR